MEDKEFDILLDIALYSHRIEQDIIKIKELEKEYEKVRKKRVSKRSDKGLKKTSERR